MTKTIALIVAAGRGHRYGGDLPKQYIELKGTAVLRHTVSAFLDHPEVSSVRVVIHPDDLTLYEQAVQGLGLEAPIWGGSTRQDSVRLGLENLSQAAPEMVLIHDGARPYPSADLISRVIEGLASAAAVIPALPITDTVKRVSGNRILETEDRTKLWTVQTPQGFGFTTILEAHRQLAGQSLTDDSAICEVTGVNVMKIEGEVANTKITMPEDLPEFSEEARQMETRTGLGFDVHRFTDGRQVILCGVAVPHSQSLEGHSDADVGLHALTDALLGAIGEGDIGHFFPPSEDQWRGAPSDLFVRHSVKLIKQRGGRIINVDITLICEAPKMGPYRNKMRDQVAKILDISAERVNIKATTTERLGFTGRREGIAAQAVANVQLSTSV